MTETTQASLYERVGGKRAFTEAVDLMYEFMQGDPVPEEQSVFRHFGDTSMPEQRRHLTEMLITAAGGPSQEERGRPSVAEAHEGRGILHVDHTITLAYMGAALGRLGLQQPELGEMVRMAESVRPRVVDPQAVQG